MAYPGEADQTCPRELAGESHSIFQWNNRVLLSPDEEARNRQPWKSGGSLFARQGIDRAGRPEEGPSSLSGEIGCTLDPYLVIVDRCRVPDNSLESASHRPEGRGCDQEDLTDSGCAGEGDVGRNPLRVYGGTHQDKPGQPVPVAPFGEREGGEERDPSAERVPDQDRSFDGFGVEEAKE